MNTFELILANQKVTNDNVLQLSQNVQQLYSMLEAVLHANYEPLQPTVSGNEKAPTEGSQNNKK